MRLLMRHVQPGSLAHCGLRDIGIGKAAIGHTSFWCWTLSGICCAGSHSGLHIECGADVEQYGSDFKLVTSIPVGTIYDPYNK